MEENNVVTTAPATESAPAAPVAPAKKPFKRMNKKKVCQFCVDMQLYSVLSTAL